MKLLFDQNLSPRLSQILAGDFPESKHVMALGLDQAPDLGAQIPRPNGAYYASPWQRHGFTIQPNIQSPERAP